MCIRAIEKKRNFFQRRAPCFNVEEVDDQTFDDQNDDVDKIELPAQRLNTNRVDVLVEDTSE